jgi:hypothetical protein
MALLLGSALTFGHPSGLIAQDSTSTAAPGTAAPAITASTATAPDTATDQPSTTVFDHPSNTRYWISGQINVIGQGHGDFPAEYSGPNSLKPESEFAVSEVLTLYTG